MLAAKSGNLYVLADSLVDIFSQNGDAIQSFRLPVQAYSLDEDKNDNLWIGTENGLLFLDIKTGKQITYNCSFKGTEVENSSFSQAFRTTDIICSSDSIIWLTSIKYGLFSFNKIANAFTPHRQPFTGSYEALNRCSALLPYGNNIWVSNMSGITCYDTKKNTFTNYNSTNGLQSTYVYDIDADANGLIWGRGNAGIFSFNLQTKQFVNYSMPLGFLGSLIYQRISILSNGIGVGFEGGYSVFSVQNHQQDVLPKAMITNCKLLNNNFYFDKDSIAVIPAVFSYKENTIQFQFTAIQFDYPEDIALSYMLENIDKSWIPANGNNIVSYANLPDGNFTFKVIANSPNGVIQGTPAIFRFSIKPPFWRLWWFQLLSIAIASGIIIMLFRQRVQRIRENEAHKTAVNKTVAELEMKTLRSRMNPHFIFNSLNSIQKFIWENKKDDASDYLSKFAKLIRLILDHSSHSYITLSEELEALKIYIELEHRRCNGRFEYAITIDENINSNLVKVPPLILQPFVENAIWHGLSPLQNKNGVLSVTIKQDADLLICEVYDNGIGRVKAAELKAQSSLSKTSVGVDITRQRLEQLSDTNRGKTFIETVDLYTDNEATGTKVIIYIPDIKE
jgi:Histidine kinase/Y_Y_Y domain